MFFHSRPATRPQTQYFQRSFPAAAFDSSWSGYDTSLDPTAYRRLALEHQRKAEKALLRAEEYELEQLQQRQVAAELERVRRELVLQEALAYGCPGYSLRQRPLDSSRIDIEDIIRQASRHLPVMSVQRQRRVPDEEPVYMTFRVVPAREEERPVSGKDSLDFSEILGVWLPGRSSQYLVADTKPTPRATPPKSALRTVLMPNKVPQKQEIHHAPAPTPSSPHSSSFSSIDAIQAELDTLKANFSLPDRLDFSSPSKDILKLAYTTRNTPFLQLESDLTKLLTKLDAIESNGAESVRGARKALVLAIELELAELDMVKMEVWTKQQGTPLEKAETAASDVTHEVVEGAQPHEDTVETVIKAAEDDVIVSIEEPEEIAFVSEPAIDPELRTEPSSTDAISVTHLIDEVVLSPSESILTIGPNTTTHDSEQEAVHVSPAVEIDERRKDSNNTASSSSPSSRSLSPIADERSENDTHLIRSPNLEPSQTSSTPEAGSSEASPLSATDEVKRSPKHQVRHKVKVEEVQDEESHSDFEML